MHVDICIILEQEMGPNKVGSFPTSYKALLACRTRGCVEAGYETRLTSGDSNSRYFYQLIQTSVL